MNEIMSFRKMVKPEDLNPSNRLFGGEIMRWLDEAAAMYAACQLKTNKIVTIKVSELLFKSPGYQGDVVEFFCKTIRVGKSSFTVGVTAKTKEIDTPSREIVTAELVFVSIDENGKPTPHNLKEFL
jgi:acyl-CoA hydrolase